MVDLVAVVFAHVHYVVCYTNIGTCHILLLLLTAPVRVSFSLLQGRGNDCKENSNQPNSRYFVDDQLLPSLDLVTVDQE